MYFTEQKSNLKPYETVEAYMCLRSLIVPLTTRRGNICAKSINCDTFSSKDKSRTFNLRKGTFNCNSSNVVYLRTCNTCEKQYVGSTITMFRELYNSYKSKFQAYFRKRSNGTLGLGKTIEQSGLFEHFTEHGNTY